MTHTQNNTPECSPECCENCSSCSVPQENTVKSRMNRIRHKILVMSGKGGVGKSTVAVNIAAACAQAGFKTGLLDIDIHGPSIPKMLGLSGMPAISDGESIIPVEYKNLKIMSVGFLLNKSDDAIIWRGPMKTGVIEQFLKDVNWGELDYLIIDSPPGTGDEPLSVCQLIENPDGAVLVTTPQQVSAEDVRKSVSFCKILNIPVLGIIENMSGFACPHCNTITHIFREGAGEKLSEEYGIPLLGKIPIEPSIGESGDTGVPYITKHPESLAAGIFNDQVLPALKISQTA